MPLLAWALMAGDCTQTDVVAPLVQPAQVRGYARFSLHGKDYPAVIKHHPDSVVDGLLLCPTNASQRRELDDFEGEAYRVTSVPVQVLGLGGRSGLSEHDDGELVDADIYLWDGEDDALSDEEWDLDVFIRERLDAWLGSFGGMELVGDEGAA